MLSWINQDKMAARECPIDDTLVEVVVCMGTTTECPNYCDYNLQKYFVMINGGIAWIMLIM